MIMEASHDKDIIKDYDSYEERLEDVKMDVSSSFTRYIALNNNMRHSMSHTYTCVPVLVYNPRAANNVIVNSR